MSASTPSRRGLQGVKWKFMSDKAAKAPGLMMAGGGGGGGNEPPVPVTSSVLGSASSSALRSSGAAVIADHSDTAALIQRARAARGLAASDPAPTPTMSTDAATRASDPAPARGTSPLPPEAYMSTEKLLQSIVSDLEAYPTALEGLNRHLREQTATTTTTRASASGPSSIPPPVSDAALIASAVPLERPSTVFSTVDPPNDEPPIVWKSEPPTAGTLFPASLELSRSVKTAAPTPMRFGRTKYPAGRSKNRNQYGSAWFIPASRWTAEAGPDGATSKAPVTDEIKRAQEEQEVMNQRFEKAQTTLANLDISKKLARYCRQTYGRPPACLTAIAGAPGSLVPSTSPIHTPGDILPSSSSSPMSADPASPSSPSRF